MAVSDVYLSLGTNVGDREANIHEAVSKLDRELGSVHNAISTIRETHSWGFQGPDFLNCVVRYKLEDADPFRLLACCKHIEAQMGRTDGPEYDAAGHRVYHDRIIDIDILLIGDLIIDTPTLKIPHPLMHERDFIMCPMNEIMPQK